MAIIQKKRKFNVIKNSNMVFVNKPWLYVGKITKMHVDFLSYLKIMIKS